VTRVETLREQVRILRSLAASFDDKGIRDSLLGLAVRCEELAAQAEASIRAAMAKPIDGRTREAS
jgi:hypothetical protein